MSQELKPRCGNCGNAYVTHIPRREASPICRKGGVYRPATDAELAAFYKEAFPEGPVPMATIRFDDAEGMARLKAALSAEALSQHMGPFGGGIDAISAILDGSVNP